MEFNPPIIRHIDDVLPHIKGKNEIIHMVKEDYQVLDYVYVLASTFDNPYASECRGLKFDLDGNLIARPSHKFHNLGENKEYSTTRVDLSLPHVRLDKLDGSMVHSCLVDGRYRLMTRKGESEVAQNATKFAKSCEEKEGEEYIDYFDFFFEMNQNGFTPIFEYVGPNNKIVIDYDKEELVLTGIRKMATGFYLPYWQMATIARRFGVPYVETYKGAHEDVANDRDKEGCIIRFGTGAMVKMKSDIYVRKHRSKDLVTKFKDLVSLIINDELDDVLPQLDEETREKVVEYRDELHKYISSFSGVIEGHCDLRKHMTQKDFALSIAGNQKVTQQLMFGTRKSGDGSAEIKRCIQRACSDTTRLTNLFNDLDFPKWEGDFFNTSE